MNFELTFVPLDPARSLRQMQPFEGRVEWPSTSAYRRWRRGKSLRGPQFLNNLRALGRQLTEEFERKRQTPCFAAAQIIWYRTLRSDDAFASLAMNSWIVSKSAWYAHVKHSMLPNRLLLSLQEDSYLPTPKELSIAVLEYGPTSGDLAIWHELILDERARFLQFLRRLKNLHRPLAICTFR